MQEQNIRSDKFSDRLAEEMKRQELKQASLARLVGVSQSRVSDWLSGKALPQLRTASALAQALGVNVEWLLKGQRYVDLKSDFEAADQEAKKHGRTEREQSLIFELRAEINILKRKLAEAEKKYKDRDLLLRKALGLEQSQTQR